ncbi:MAG TPA: TonB family protein [Candidatus Acidoferrales bacterium]|nr:TonB family protein [Candidatus Acidoferrales bacterium]
MRRIAPLAAGLCLAALPAAAQELERIDPQHAKLELENDQVRVVRVKVGPHEKLPMHEHDLPAVVVYLTDVRARTILPDGSTVETQRHAGDAVWSRGGVRHAAENLGDAPYEVVEIELKPPRPTTESAGNGATATPQTASEYEKVEFENPRVRVLRVRVGPHGIAPMHDRSERVMVWLTDFHVRVVLPDGRSAARQRRAGEVAWAPADRHAGENLSDQPFELIAVELKPAPKGYLSSNVELLTSTDGVDFKVYLTHALATFKRNWYALIPESARQGEKGRTVVQLRILRDGNVPAHEAVLFSSSGKSDLDRAALAAIRVSSPLGPLPAAFSGPAVELRVTFLCNLPVQGAAPLRAPAPTLRGGAPARNAARRWLGSQGTRRSRPN